MSLNVSQKEAINTIHGPCLVLAGAGSGKTTVIVSKIIQLINIGQYCANEIFAITFTNKAAREMKTRIEKKINIQIKIKHLNIFTFHALGMKIINHELNLLTYKKNYSLFNQFDQLRLIKNILRDDFKEETGISKKLLIYISNQKNKLISPLESKRRAISTIEKKFSKYYQIYNEYLEKYNVFDFDDLIYVPIMLFQKYASVLYKWQNYVKYLLVDEYQDTNYIQYQLIKLLTKNNPNFTLVGDDDQSIYSWRGANSENLFLLKNDYPNLKIIKMEHNYRSSKRILKVANQLISNNPHLFQKKLFSHFDYGVKIKILYVQNEQQEAQKIIQKILLHKLNNHGNYKDYAILYRNNYQVKVFEKLLIQLHIPYVIYGNFSFFNQPEIKDLLTYLKFIINQNDDAAFLKIINIPSRRIGNITIKKIKKWAKKKHTSCFNIIIDVDFQKEIRTTTYTILKNFFLWIKKIIVFAEKYPLKLLQKIIHDIKYEQWLLKNVIRNKDIKISMKNIQFLSNWMINTFQNSMSPLSDRLFDVIHQLLCHDMDTDNDRYHDNAKNKIQLMTIHASKGLEFPSVFIIGLEEGILPHHRNFDQNINEERRLMYVAITRAQTELTFSYCKKRFYYGEILNTQPSRFLFELPREDVFWKKLF